MSQGKLPDGISETGTNVGMIRHYRCEKCGKVNEIRLRDVVPSHFYNAVREFARAAAGDEFVILPVTTLNAMGEERERLARELEAR